MDRNVSDIEKMAISLKVPCSGNRLIDDMIHWRVKLDLVQAVLSGMETKGDAEYQEACVGNAFGVANKVLERMK